jgi:hypothetical protein
MFKTGNPVADFFLLMETCFLPLVTVLLILLRKNQLREPLNLLLLLCLFLSIAGLFLLMPLNDDNQRVIQNVFSLFEFILLIQIFKTNLDGITKYRLNILMVAFLSATVTYFSLKGWGISNLPLNTLKNAILVGVILLSILPLISVSNLTIFQSPLFWIAGGTLFYLLLIILMEWVSDYCLPAPLSNSLEKMIFLSIAGFIRYLFYILASLAHPLEKGENDRRI